MKIKILTTCDNPNHDGYLKLKASLERFGYDYEMIQHKFEFGHQLPVIQKWCNNPGDYTHILYTDAFDTLALGHVNELLLKIGLQLKQHKMMISCEKGCYPHPERAGEYPETKYDWRYVNGGGWFVEIEYFKKLCEKENLNADSHDQVWLMDAFLRNQEEIKLDYDCEVFQTIAFEGDDDFGDSEDEFGRMRIYNRKTETCPIFIHGNGRTDMTWVYQMI